MFTIQLSPTIHGIFSGVQPNMPNQRSLDSDIPCLGWADWMQLESSLLCPLRLVWSQINAPPLHYLTFSPKVKAT